ncbi:MAG: hypothetical protein ACI9J3_003196 [Parvicellaceae bacterium]|jgi:predicted component of type VI protein secretion system
MEIRIKIEVNNADEVLKVHKGGVLGFIADVVLSKSKKKQKVEKAVCEQIIAGLEEELSRRLEEEMVKTTIEYEIIEPGFSGEDLDQ